MDQRFFRYAGGPRDGMECWLVPTGDERDPVTLPVVTDKCLHTYQSDKPLEFYGPGQAIDIYHKPDRTRPRPAGRPV